MELAPFSLFPSDNLTLVPPPLAPAGKGREALAADRETQFPQEHLCVE